MRASIAIGLYAAATALLAVTPVRGQASPANNVLVLDAATRVTLLNSLLIARRGTFDHPMQVDWCGLVSTVGPGVDPTPPDFKNAVVNRTTDKCPTPQRSDIPIGTDLVIFERIGFELTEWLSHMPDTSPRPPGLMVVHAIVFSSGSAYHTEEWIMQRAAFGWGAMTIRIFDFIVS